MKKQKNKSNIFLQIFIVISMFAIISTIYFWPVTQGKALHQSDIIQWQGQSKEIIDYREQTGEQPLWTNSMFGGMPSYLISCQYPTLWRWLANHLGGTGMFSIIVMILFIVLIQLSNINEKKGLKNGFDEWLNKLSWKGIAIIWLIAISIGGFLYLAFTNKILI